MTKVNVVPPCIGTGSRSWWVSTNTGAWYGGSSPHQPVHVSSHGPSPPPNILRPMMNAPMPCMTASATSESALRLPPFSPCCSRQASVGNAQWCRRSPPSPIGSFLLWLGPATKPSSEMEIWQVTWLMRL